MPSDNFINGKSPPAADGAVPEILDPAVGEPYAVAARSGLDDVDCPCQAAESAFENWRRTTPTERSLAMLRFADAVEEATEELVTHEVTDTGKPIELTRTEELPPVSTTSASSAAQPDV